MGAYQYCECGRELSYPSTDEIIDGYIECTCGERAELFDGEEMKNDLLKELMKDVERLMEQGRLDLLDRENEHGS